MSEAAVATPPAKTNGVTKLEAVRQAMQKLGKDASRSDLQAFVKKHFGYEMSLDYISNYKNKVQTSTGKAKKPAAPKPVAAAPKAEVIAPKAAAIPAVAPKVAAPKAAAPKPAAKKSAAPKPAAPKAAPHGKSAEGISLDDIESVKGLVGRVGPDQLRGLVDLLAK